MLIISGGGSYGINRWVCFHHTCNQTFRNSPGKPVGVVLGGFQSPGGQTHRSGDSRGDTGLCVESPAGAEELAGMEEISSAEKRLLALWK